MESSHNRIFIFLDIDGVLNTSAQWKRMYQLDDGCIARFNEYIRALSTKGSVQIILTSSWKNDFAPAGHHTPQIQAFPFSAKQKTARTATARLKSTTIFTITN